MSVKGPLVIQLFTAYDKHMSTRSNIRGIDQSNEIEISSKAQMTKSLIWCQMTPTDYAEILQVFPSKENLCKNLAGLSVKGRSSH